MTTEPSSLGPIGRRQTLDMDAADRIRAAIFSRYFESGSRLTETTLAEELGVSRGTVRSALRLLANEGLVDFRPTGGAFVSKFEPSDAWELYTLRNALEGLAARLAANQITPQGREALEGVISRLQVAIQNGDRTQAVELEQEFHLLIFALAGHRRLREAYEVLEVQTAAFLSLTLSDRFHPDLEKVLVAHEQLAKAIIEGNSERAEMLAAQHNTEDGQLLINELKALPDQRS